MARVVIAGGGVIGCATAYFLAREGAKVTLLERGDLAGEASGAAAGILAPLSDEGANRGEAFQSLCLDSLALYQSLLPALYDTGIDLHYRRSGVLHIALDDAEALQLRHRFDHQRAIAPGNIWREADDLRKLEPALSSTTVAGMLSPDEHYLDPANLTLALAEAAKRNGASIETNRPATGFRRRGERLVGVATPDGVVEADDVLVAGGPWTARIAQRLHASVPVRPVRGQMLSLAGPEPPLKHVIWGSSVYLVPREGGQTFAGATVEEAGFRRRTTSASLARLRRGAAALVPALGGVKVLRALGGPAARRRRTDCR